ncbi:methionine--tRNA ligase subunit beta [Oxyplasma meridianum]|uniref:Methionine--tRNA ligase n=1 Tax=Oxyplasma meridianum TaxID=3073602 RepID=A0AAX4NIK7_9ARCH
MEENEELIDIEDFRKISIKTGKVLECEKVEKSRSLLRIVVDLGDEKRQIISSIYPSYKPDEMVGKILIVLANLKKAKFMGLESQGMLLAVDDQDTLSLLTTDRVVSSGLKVS